MYCVLVVRIQLWISNLSGCGAGSADFADSADTAEKKGGKVDAGAASKKIGYPVAIKQRCTGLPLMPRSDATLVMRSRLWEFGFRWSGCWLVRGFGKSAKPSIQVKVRWYFLTM